MFVKYIVFFAEVTAGVLVFGVVMLLLFLAVPGAARSCALTNVPSFRVYSLTWTSFDDVVEDLELDFETEDFELDP